MTTGVHIYKQECKVRIENTRKSFLDSKYVADLRFNACLGQENHASLRLTALQRDAD